MIGRKVASPWYRLTSGTVTDWQPTSAAMCDCLVVDDCNGAVCWYSSRDLRPIDGKGPLPSRKEAKKRAEAETLTSLRAIREIMVKEIRERKPWPGCEHGKAILGMAVDGAIADLTR